MPTYRYEAGPQERDAMPGRQSAVAGSTYQRR